MVKLVVWGPVVWDPGIPSSDLKLPWVNDCYSYLYLYLVDVYGVYVGKYPKNPDPSRIE